MRVGVLLLLLLLLPLRFHSASAGDQQERYTERTTRDVVLWLKDQKMFDQAAGWQKTSSLMPSCVLHVHCDIPKLFDNEAWGLELLAVVHCPLVHCLCFTCAATFLYTQCDTIAYTTHIYVCQQPMRLQNNTCP